MARRAVRGKRAPLGTLPGTTLLPGVSRADVSRALVRKQTPVAHHATPHLDQLRQFNGFFVPKSFVPQVKGRGCKRRREDGGRGKVSSVGGTLRRRRKAKKGRGKAREKEHVTATHNTTRTVLGELLAGMVHGVAAGWVFVLNGRVGGKFVSAWGG